ncbi:MAG: hypothetical protein ACJ763_04710 [Bdellovibrionia bacterium]
MRELLKKPQAKYWALGFAVLVGILFRLIWATDMEYKKDEWTMFTATQEIGITKPWPWLGMESGVGTLNPGMSMWLFVAIARVFQATDPVGLVRGVQTLNCLALIILAVFAAKWSSKSEKTRETWMWGAAIAALNPLAVLTERKIWAQSALPLFSMIALIGYLKRNQRSYAFVWGLLGACLGQVHMPGFFFSLVLLIWAIAFDPERKKTRWGAYLLGSILGALPLLPWLKYMHDNPSSSPGFREPLSLQYWVLWLSDAIGAGLDYSLRRDFKDFLFFPYLGERPTYLVGVLHILAIIIGLVIFYGAIRRFFSQKGQKIRTLLGMTSPEALVLSASFFGYGLLMTLIGVLIHRHYLILTFPLEFLWLACLGTYQRSERLGRVALLSMCVVQAMISLSFLSYIHVRGGSPNGDYGVAYSHQKR